MTSPDAEDLKHAEEFAQNLKQKLAIKGSRATSQGGGGVSLLLFIAFCIKVYVDGNWNVAIATWTLNYVVYSMLWILIWILIIFGIPATIAAIWWIRREVKKKP
jgi:hypothetical protein